MITCTKSLDFDNGGTEEGLDSSLELDTCSEGSFEVSSAKLTPKTLHLPKRLVWARVFSLSSFVSKVVRASQEVELAGMTSCAGKLLTGLHPGAMDAGGQ